jgi:hypothetical protein
MIDGMGDWSIELFICPTFLIFIPAESRQRRKPEEASTMDYVSDEQHDQPLSIRIGTACVSAIAVIWSGYLLWTLVAMVQ